MVVAKAATGLVLYGEYLDRRWRRGRRARPLPEEEERAQDKGFPHADALLVGFAMIARGEIGFLIASLSQSSGTLGLMGREPATAGKGGGGAGGDVSQDLFLVIVWAVVLCTIIGPVAVGTIVRRQARRNRNT